MLLTMSTLSACPGVSSVLSAAPCPRGDIMWGRHTPRSTPVRHKIPFVQPPHRSLRDMRQWAAVTAAKAGGICISLISAGVRTG